MELERCHLIDNRKEKKMWIDNKKTTTKEKEENYVNQIKNYFDTEHFFSSLSLAMV